MSMNLVQRLGQKWFSYYMMNIYTHIPVAAQVLSVPEHTIRKAKVQLQYATIPVAEQYENNKLLIRQIPQQVDEEHLQLFLESTLKMVSQDDFVVEVRGGSAMITFLSAQISNEGMQFCVVFVWIYRILLTAALKLFPWCGLHSLFRCGYVVICSNQYSRF